MANKSYDDLVDMLTVQKANIGEFKDELDATGQELLEITEDLDNLTYLKGYSETIDTNKKGVTQIKSQAFNGDESEPIGEFPVFAAGALPHPAAKADALGRHNATNARWKTAPGYTNQIGITMAIVSAPPANAVPAEVVPTIDVFEAQTGSHFSVVVGNRQQADSWRVMVMRKGANTWEVAETGIGKSCDVQLMLQTPGEPEQVQVRIQLRKGGADYGQLSQTVWVTLNP